MVGIVGQLTLELCAGFIVLPHFPIQVPEPKMHIGFARRDGCSGLELHDDSGVLLKPSDASPARMCAAAGIGIYQNLAEIHRERRIIFLADKQLSAST